MKAIKHFGFKLIVILCVVSTFCCFVASIPVNAASKVKTDEFYYSGTTKGSYTVDKGFLENLLSALEAILDYLLGIMTMGFRIVIVGWTELLERILTWIIEGASGVEVNAGDVQATGLSDHDDYITFEAIVFNKVYIFNINFFNFNINEDYNSLGKDLVHDSKGNEIPKELREKSDISEDSLIIILKKVVSGWYYSFRLLSIIIMLILLIYIGIKLAIASATKEKAFYKQVLFDWITGLILVFSIHYVILAMIYFNELLVAEIQKMDIGYNKMNVYEYGLIERADTGVTSEDMELTMYDEVRTRSYDAKLTVGTTGMVMYAVLVYYAWKFSFIYLKRYLVVAVLIMMAPFISVTYAYNRVRSGKATIFTNWLKELCFMIALQSIHALLYVIFMESALVISLSSISGMFFSFIMLHYMTQAEEIFRKIFNIQGKLTNDVSGSKLKDIKNAVTGLGMGAVGKKAALATTKFAGRIVSKPYRALAEAGFGKAMEWKANEDNRLSEKIDKLEKKTKEIYRNGGKVSVRDLEKIKKLKELKIAKEKKKQSDKAKEIERQRYLVLGSLAKNLPDDPEDLTEEQLEKLEEARQLFPKSSNDDPERVMDKDEYIEDFYSNKDQYASKFDEITKPTEVLAHEIKTRLGKMMEPTQYLEKEKNKGNQSKKSNNNSNDDSEENEEDEENKGENNGENDEENDEENDKYKRKKTEREHENWGPLLKYFSKKKSGVGHTFNLKYLNTDFLLGLDKKQRSLLKAYFDGGVKEELAGFSGILLGLPLVVAEPGLGVGFLAKGISSTLKAKETLFGTSAKKKNLKNLYMTADGKYHLVGYNTKAVETIANGIQAAARENAEDVERGREEHNKQVIRRTKKHTKIFSALTGGQKFQIGVGATAATLGTIAAITVTPATFVVGTIAVGTVLTGSILQAIKPNAYVGLEEIRRTAGEKNQKKWKKELKSTDSLLKCMSERYYEVEKEKNRVLIQKAEHDIEESNSEFEKEYGVAVASIIDSVEKYDDYELLREAGDDVAPEVITNQDGTKKLLVASEKQLIDKAIIEIIQKSGIIKLDEFNLDDSNKMELVKKIITEKLLDKGIITKGQKADDIIDHLDDKIMSQKSELERTNPDAIEEKMLYDSYIAVMKKKKIKKPTEVKKEDVEEEFVRRLQNMIDTPTSETNTVIDGLERQKREESDSEQGSRESEEIIERVQENTRKSKTEAIIKRANDSLPDVRERIAKRIDEELGSEGKLAHDTRKKLEESLIRNRIRRIDNKIASTQIEIREGKFVYSETDEMSDNNTNSDLNNPNDVSEQSDVSIGTKSETDRIIETEAILSRIQKERFDRVARLRSYLPPKTKREREQLYVAQLFDNDGTIRIDKFADGSVRANISRDGSVRTQISRDGSNVVSLQEIMSKVIREKMNRDESI